AGTLDEHCVSVFRDLLRHGIAGGFAFTAKGDSAGVEILGEQSTARLVLRKMSWARFRAAIDGGVPGGPVPAASATELGSLLRRAAALKTAEDLAWAANRQHRPVPPGLGELLANPIHGLPSFKDGGTADADPVPSGRRVFALLVGINDGGLIGCHNDVEAVQ